MYSLLDADRELIQIKFKGAGVALPVVRRQRLLIGKEQVVIFPEMPLVTGTPGCLRSPARLTVNRQRKILPHHADPISVSIPKSREHGLELPAVRTLEV